MVAYAVHAVMAVYIPGRSVNQMIDWIILPFVLVLLYIAMNSAFKKYLLTQQKYHTTENKKVIVVNDKYLQKKKRRKFKKYHSFFEED